MKSVPTAGGRCAYADIGEGPVVLLLHGFPESSYVWRDLAPLLATGFRVIVPDLLGAGGSDKPQIDRLSLRAQTASVEELLAALDVERLAVIGHGFGGGVAQLLALDSAGVDAMVLIDSIAFDAWPDRATRDLQLSPPDEESELAAEAALRAAFRDGIANAVLAEDDLAEYLRPYAGSGGAAAYFRSVRAMDGEGLSGREDDLAKLEIPVLIFWGEEDRFYPTDVAERLNGAIPTSTLGLLPGCGHFLIDEAVQTIGPMIHEYLRARYLGVPHGHTDPTGAVMIQLERRPPWLDLAEDEADDWFDVDDEEDG